MPDHALRIVLPGGSGQVGQMLARSLSEARPSGHRAHPRALHRSLANRALGRRTTRPLDRNPGGRGRLHQPHRAQRQLPLHAANRAAIYDSRIGSTRLLDRVIAGLANPPRVWLNASTATIYRHALDRPMDEATGEMGGNELIGKGAARPIPGTSPSVSPRIGRPRSLNRDSAHPQDSPAQRHRLQPHARQRLRRPLQPGASGAGRRAGQRTPVRLLDSRDRLCPRRRVPDRSRRAGRPHQHRRAQSAAQPRVHGRPARCVG